MMELELGLALLSARPAPAGELDLLNSAPGSCGKRGFGAKATLPLFVRDDGSGRGGGDDDGDWEMSTKRKKLVGWPPVKCVHRRNGGGGGYVKVKMEGVAIGRKVNLSLHTSYEELLDTLDRMFPSTDQDAREESNQDDHHHRHPYAVTYEDEDGDWLLVGDVPWEAFAKSVKRLKILV